MIIKKSLRFKEIYAKMQMRLKFILCFLGSGVKSCTFSTIYKIVPHFYGMAFRAIGTSKMILL